jgi:hypothetical protein
VTPLRQWNARVAAAPAWLYEPQVAYRIRRGDDEGTPFPLDEPAGENPPEGAIINYQIGARGAHAVALAILDTAGRTIRRWSSSDVPATIDPRKLDVPASWIVQPALPGVTPGLHRFVWDVRYAVAVPPSPDEAEDPFFVPGVWAVPGTYTVRLTVDDRTFTEPLRLLLDPRESATDADLAAQFDFTEQVEALRIDVLHAARRQPQNQRYADIDAALARIESSAQSAPAAPTADERSALDQQRSAFAAATGAAPQQ